MAHLSAKKQKINYLKLLAGNAAGGISGYFLARELGKAETPFVLGGQVLGATITAFLVLK